MKTTLLVSTLAGSVTAQQGPWAQCGGIGWTGGTTCQSGWTCVFSNPYYSQCLQSTGSSTTTTTKTTTTTARTTLRTTTKVTTTTTTTTTTTSAAASTSPASPGKFKWFGVDESGAEFGQATIPGTWGKDFTFASTSTIDTLMSQGFNIFRLPFLMERMVNTLTSPINQAYFNNYTAVVNHITQKGGYAIVDPHNFGRFNGAIITSTSDFGTFWGNLAQLYASNANVVFDTNNEYHDMDQTLVLNLNQAAINAIRAAGATSQYIFAEGNSYTGAWTWTQVNTNMAALTDPSNKLVYEMHQYLDSDGSGTSATCVSSTIGVERVTSATQWLKQNNKLGFLGEYAGGANSVCQTAITGMLDYMQQNSDVWLGAAWWGGGPWWGTYIYGFEPPTSTAYDYYDALLESYAP